MFQTLQEELEGTFVGVTWGHESTKDEAPLIAVPALIANLFS